MKHNSIYAYYFLAIALSACITFCILCLKSKQNWICSCGNENTGKFCTECGAEKSEANVAASWTCSCGNVNKGKFCSECGAQRPAEALLFKCDRCGWEPEDSKNPPKLCPKCGEPYTEIGTGLS